MSNRFWPHSDGSGGAVWLGSHKGTRSQPRARRSGGGATQAAAAGTVQRGGGGQPALTANGAAQPLQAPLGVTRDQRASTGHALKQWRA